jgi:hypothetical protein
MKRSPCQEAPLLKPGFAMFRIQILFPKMAFPAKPGACLLFFFFILLVTRDTLVMECFLEIDATQHPMTFGTSDPLASLLKRAFIQHVFPIPVLMMTILTCKSSLHMEVMRKGDRRSFSFLKGLGMVQYDLVWLCHEVMNNKEQWDSDEEDH